MRNEQTIDPDERFVEALRALGGRLDPVPGELTADAIAAFSWRTVDKDLAALTYDSVLDDDRPVGAGAAGASRQLTFVGRGLTVEVEVGHGVLQGRLVPPSPAEVELRWPGDSVAVRADELGRFSVPAIPRGPVSLRCQGGPTASGPTVVTDWVTL